MRVERKFTFVLQQFEQILKFGVGADRWIEGEEVEFLVLGIGSVQLNRCAECRVEDRRLKENRFHSILLQVRPFLFQT